MDEIENAGAVIAIVSGVFGCTIVLLLYIWNLTQKANDKRHESSEALIAELVESKHTNDLILLELKMITSQHANQLNDHGEIIKRHLKS
jgi:hypothetical protein